jgi:hypothetical protein
MVKKVCIDTTSVTNKKYFSFNFNFDSKLSRDKIAATMKEIMSEYNPNYSIYISTKDFEGNIDSIEDIKLSLENIK